MRISPLSLPHRRRDRPSWLTFPDHPAHSLDVLVVRDDVTRNQIAQRAQDRLCERNRAFDRGRCVKDVENAAVITLGKPSHRHTIRRMSYGPKPCTNGSFAPWQVCFAWLSSSPASSCSVAVAPRQAPRSFRPGTWPCAQSCG